MSAVLASYSSTPSRTRTLSHAGQLFLAVLLILVYEGAIRKWVTTSASLPLIALRDLCAVTLILLAWRRGELRRNRKLTVAMFAWSLLVFGWGLLQLVGGESSPIVFILGLRFWLLYSWFAIAAAASLTEADYRLTIRIAAWMLLLMAPLAILQHYSPPGAPVNAQLEGDETGIFTVGDGVVRTTGSFSFTAGYSMFMTLVAPFVFGLLSARKRRAWQLPFAIAVFSAFAIGSLVSGSRTTVIWSGLMFITYLAGRLLWSKMRQKPAAAVAVIVSLALFAVFAIFFEEAIMVTQTRFEQASEAEDFWARTVSVLVAEPEVFSNIDWLGSGIGFGSNLANYVHSGSTSGFALTESEGGRILLEGGLLGIVYVGLKLVVAVIGIAKSLRLSMKTNSPFPALVWLTVAMALITWPTTGQLTGNGMIGVMLGLGLLLFRFPGLEIFPPRAPKKP